MVSPRSSAIRPRELVELLYDYRRLWLIPTAVCALLTIGYVLCQQGKYEARQTLALRNEAVGGTNGVGRFRHPDDLKVSQETVFEVARSRSVLEAALVEVGPPGGVAAEEGWPTQDEVADLRESIRITPPKGTEPGKSEILHLTVTAPSRQRALALVAAIEGSLQTGLQQVRRTKAQSMIRELEQSLTLAEDDLSRATQTLATLEEQVGTDLAELRMLDTSATGDSDLHRKLATIEHELRESANLARTNRELHKLLLAAQDDPGHLLATPNRLLDSQPALRRLKDGLVDAQLRTAQLRGAMTEAHPQALAARAAEEEISRHLHSELAIAVRGVELDLRLTEGRINTLADERDACRDRLESLAALRADYSRLASATRHRTSVVEQAQRDLAEARASLAAAMTVSLISPVDQPDAPSRPVGPAKSMIVLAGTLGGLLIGLGLVYLVAPPLSAVESDDAELLLVAGEKLAQPEQPLQKAAARIYAPSQGPRHVLSLQEALVTISRRSPARG